MLRLGQAIVNIYGHMAVSGKTAAQPRSAGRTGTRAGAGTRPARATGGAAGVITGAVNSW